MRVGQELGSEGKGLYLDLPRCFFKGWLPKRVGQQVYHVSYFHHKIWNVKLFTDCSIRPKWVTDTPLMHAVPYKVKKWPTRCWLPADCGLTVSRQLTNTSADVLIDASVGSNSLPLPNLSVPPPPSSMLFIAMKLSLLVYNIVGGKGNCLFYWCH